jgi:hypothetical protein
MSELRKKGRAKALKNGVKFGRKRTITDAQRKNVLELLNEGKTYSQISELTGISRAMVYLIKKPEKAKQFNQQHKLQLAKQRAVKFHAVPLEEAANIDMKVCIDCKIEKPFLKFNRISQNRDYY